LVLTNDRAPTPPAVSRASPAASGCLFAPLAAVALLPWLGGCFLDYSGLTGGDSGVSDAPEDSAATPDASDCSGSHGPQAVRVGTFCMDSTEVTRGQYAEFLGEASTGGQPAYCDWNSSYEPASDWPPAGAQENLPVVSVDWCDARAFCDWAGKSLCGRLDGEPNTIGGENNAATSAWYFACTHNGERDYPYGSTFESGVCVGDTANAGPQAVGTASGCEGGFAGLFDLSGNVEEWVNTCNQATGANDDCYARGGNYSQDSSSELACSTPSVALQTRDTAEPWFGFRCCVY
jgi:formylglycine-generating enzyme required for sulfatase activity